MSVVAVLDNVTIMTQREEIRKQLINKATKQGFITYADILELMPDVESDVALLDDLMDSLLEAGVEVVPGNGKDVEEEEPKANKDDTDLYDSSPRLESRAGGGRTPRKMSSA